MLELVHNLLLDGTTVQESIIMEFVFDLKLLWRIKHFKISFVWEIFFAPFSIESSCIN